MPENKPVRGDVRNVAMGVLWYSPMQRIIKLSDQVYIPVMVIPGEGRYCPYYMNEYGEGCQVFETVKEAMKFLGVVNGEVSTEDE